MDTHILVSGIHGISSKTPKKPKKETTCQLCGENKKEIKTAIGTDKNPQKINNLRYGFNYTSYDFLKRSNLSSSNS